MAKRTVKRVILIDDPSSEDLFHGKGHEKTAIALANTISEFAVEDRAIGIDGPWGSGKSSIVEMADKKLTASKTNTDPAFHFFTFDIWKSQGSAFRRSFLEHLLFWAQDHFPTKKNKLKEIENIVKSKTRSIDTDSQANLDWYGIMVLLGLPFLPIYYFWAKKVFDSSKGSDFLFSKPFLLLLFFVAVTLIKALMNIKDKKDSFREALSRTLLISSKQYAKQRVTQHIRETDPNDFEFQATLLKILNTIQDKKNKVVIILDNIDRLPADEINEYWALVRSIFSRNSILKMEPNNTITAIVPYSRENIQENIKNAREDDKEQTLSSLSSRELFSKTFDEILVVAPPVMSNSKEFFEEKLKKALPKFKNTNELFRVYLIFNSILRAENGHATPRQIISFVNDLTGLYVMHSGHFQLTIIATYLAYRDQLENDPSVLTKPDFLSSRLKNLTKEPDIEMKLAALVYNVDESLAFQLLLDNRISAAATHEESSELLKLSNSPGFDIRVNEVVLDNAIEWVQTGEFEQVIENFSLIHKEYSGEAKEALSASLISSFSKVKEISLDEEHYSSYLRLIQMSDNGNINSIALKIAQMVLKTLRENEKFGFGDGQKWNEFISLLRAQINSQDVQVDIDFVLSNLRLPSGVDFVLGVGSSAKQYEFSLSSYQYVGIDLTEGEDELGTFAKKYSNLALPAFIEFNSSNILEKEHWVEIGNSIIENFIGETMEDPALTSHLLDILGLVWIYSKRDTNLESQFKVLFLSPQFYSSLYVCYSDDLGHLGLAHAVFLASQFYLASDKPIPFRPASKVEYIWFNEIFIGDDQLNEQQIQVIAQKVKADLRVTGWLTEGQKQESNTLINNVLFQLFSANHLPWIMLETLILRYVFLKTLLNGKHIQMLSNFESRISEDDLKALSLRDTSLSIIEDSFLTDKDGWNNFHSRISDQLQTISADEWIVHLKSGSHNIRILDKIISTSGIVFDTPNFRDAYQGFIFSMLRGEISALENNINHDQLLRSINRSYHGEIFRKIREITVSTSNAQIRLFFENFQALTLGVLTNGDRIPKKEKENIIRNFLCPALETSTTYVLDIFIDIGRVKISKFIKDSSETTQDKLDGALSSYLTKNSKTEFTNKVTELIKGKKSKNFLERWLGADTRKNE